MNMKSRLISMLLTGFVLALGLLIAVQVTQSLRTTGEAPEQPVVDVQDLNKTISPVIFTTISEQNNELRLSGSCEPDAIVTLQNQGENLRQVKADEDGLWSVVLKVKDDTVLVLDLIVYVENGVKVMSDETLFRIPQPQYSDLADDEGSLSALLMIAAPGGPTRIVQSPFKGAPTMGALSVGPIDYDQSGSVIFSGSSEIPGQVQVFANNVLVGVTRVGPNGRWSFIAADTLPLGDYDITIELLSSEASSARIVLPFERLRNDSNEGAVLPLDIKYKPLSWQISRRLFGGGRQFTAVFAPNEPTVESLDAP